MPDCLIIRASSRVVRETSTSQNPDECISLLRMISNFLAVQGMIETTYTLAGSSPTFSA